jgi:hypothetical protein
MSDRYLFVDAGHLRYYRDTMRDWFGEEPDLEYGTLKANAFKCFHYDCLDDLPRSGEGDPDRQTRIAMQEAEFSRIRSIPGTHVRLGSLTGSDKNRRQKEVDIQLAVDMLNHAVRHNMKYAVLLSGDRDFKPVIETLVEMGLYVEVHGDFRHTSSALAGAADFYRPLTILDYFHWSSERQKNAHPIPQIAFSVPDTTGCQLLRHGNTRDIQAKLYRDRGNNYLFVGETASQTIHLRIPDEQRLSLFLRHHFGEIHWVSAAA